MKELSEMELREVEGGDARSILACAVVGGCFFGPAGFLLGGFLAYMSED